MNTLEKTKLNFNEMLNTCWGVALSFTKRAKLYQASSPNDLSFIHCIFRGDDEYATVMVNCTSSGKTQIVTVDSPYLDDCVIHPPIEMTQTESEQYLTAAGYSNWTCVCLREPLYSVKYNPLYIYTVPSTLQKVGGYIGVDSTDGAIIILE